MKYGRGKGAALFWGLVMFSATGCAANTDEPQSTEAVSEETTSEATGEWSRADIYDEPYYLVSRSSGRCLAIDGDDATYYRRVVQRGCTGLANAAFRFYSDDAYASHMIIPMSAAELVLAVVDGRQDNGAYFYQAPRIARRYASDWMHRFDIDRVGDSEYFTIRNRLSSRCMTVDDDRRDDFAPIVQWNCRRDWQNQHWRLLRASQAMRLYSGLNYGGLGYFVGDGVYNRPRMMRYGYDGLSSLFIPDGWKALLYDQDDFKGEQLELLAGGYPDLSPYNYNRRMASFVAAKEYARIYGGRYYTGYERELRPGRYALHELGLGDDGIYSLRVPAGWKVSLYDHPDFRGSLREYRGPIVSPLLDGFGGRAKSLAVDLYPFDDECWAY